MGVNPYGNGSTIVWNVGRKTDLCKLLCICSLPDFYEFKLSELSAYVVPRDVYVRGYGSLDEIALPGDEQKRAS